MDVDNNTKNDVIDSFRGEYLFLSNFYQSPITYNGITYGHSESAFQAQKCLERADEFVNISPLKAKRLGKQVPLREDWEQIKVGIMTDVLRTKFSDPYLRDKLLATGNAHLEEGNDWGDTLWGTVNGVGQNLLGKILMQVRDECRYNVKNN